MAQKIRWNSNNERIWTAIIPKSEEYNKYIAEFTTLYGIFMVVFEHIPKHIFFTGFFVFYNPIYYIVLLSEKITKIVVFTDTIISAHIKQVKVLHIIKIKNSFIWRKKNIQNCFRKPRQLEIISNLLEDFDIFSYLKTVLCILLWWYKIRWSSNQLKGIPKIRWLTCFLYMLFHIIFLFHINWKIP